MGVAAERKSPGEIRAANERGGQMRLGLGRFWRVELQVAGGQEILSPEVIGSKLKAPHSNERIASLKR